MTTTSHTFRLAFTNPGEIDIRGAIIAGLSDKAAKASAIGKFGTGLKYGISCILRWGGQITIYSGLTCHQFTTSTIDFRGAEHALVLHNGQPTGFTTHYGHQWKPWQVFRELLSNALDEGGEVWLGDEKLNPPAEGQTVILVRCDNLRAAYDERDEIILPRQMLWDSTSKICQIKDNPSPSLFYKGVRVHDRKCVLTWNFLDTLELTEDRTLKDTWTASNRAARAIQACTSEILIFRFLNAGQATFEHNARSSLSSWHDMSAEFKAVALRLWRKDQKAYSFLKDIIKEIAPEALELPSLPMSPMQQAMLARACAFVDRMNVGRTSDYTIKLGDLDGSACLGEANRATGTITLSPEVFRQGTKQVVSTLLEEMVHLTTGKDDCNYDMQTYLFNTIVSLYEEHVFGEPI
jgi:hypothetical protein